MEIDASDVIRILLQFLQEQGLTSSLRALQAESGVILGAHPHPASIVEDACAGRWDAVLSAAATLSVPPRTLGALYEQIVRELVGARELEAARALLRGAPALVALRADDPDAFSRLESLVARGASAAYEDGGGGAGGPEGVAGPARDAARARVGASIAAAATAAPPSRLLTLLGQALRWQAHTGELVNGAGGAVSLLVPPSARAGVSSGAIRAPDDLVRRRAPLALAFGAGGAPVAIFSPDGASLIVGGRDGLVEVYDARSGRVRTDLEYQSRDEFMAHDTAITCAAVSRDGEMLATGDATGSVKVWSLAAGSCLRRFAAVGGSSRGAVGAVAWTRDASAVLVGGADGAVRLLGLRSGAPLRELHGHGALVSAVAILDDPRDGAPLAFSGGADGTLRAWNLRTGEPSAIVPLPVDADAPGAVPPPVLALLCSRRGVGGMAVVVVTRARTAHALKRDGSHVRSFALPSARTNYAAATLSMSGEWLYALDDGMKLHAFAVETGAHVLSGDVPAHTAHAPVLIAHPMRPLLVSVADDGKLASWEPEA